MEFACVGPLAAHRERLTYRRCRELVLDRARWRPVRALLLEGDPCARRSCQVAKDEAQSAGAPTETRTGQNKATSRAPNRQGVRDRGLTIIRRCVGRHRGLVAVTLDERHGVTGAGQEQRGRETAEPSSSHGHANARHRTPRSTAPTRDLPEREKPFCVHR